MKNIRSCVVLKRLVNLEEIKYPDFVHRTSIRRYFGIQVVPNPNPNPIQLIFIYS